MRLEGSFENSENFSLCRCKLLIISVFILQLSEFCFVKLLSDAGSFQHFVKGPEFRIFAPANRKIVTP